MFNLIPSKEDQAIMRYWMRNWYKAHMNRANYRNTAYASISDATPLPLCMQDRNQRRVKPRLMTEAEKGEIIRRTGHAPLFDRLFVPVPRGRSRSSMGRKVST